MRITYWIAALAVLLTGTSVMAIEEPAFTELQEKAEYELRRYAPYLVAEVDVQGEFDDAGSAAFKILAGYIFGENESQQKMQMTAPVESTSVRMAMTAPVISYERQDSADAASNETFTFAFVMESKYTRETLPVPNDSRIRIVSKPARVVAARRFSGRWTERNYDKNETVLLEALRSDGLEVIGAPWFARYNMPLTPWFLRRNEVIVEIDYQGE